MREGRKEGRREGGREGRKEGGREEGTSSSNLLESQSEGRMFVPFLSCPETSAPVVASSISYCLRPDSRTARALAQSTSCSEHRWTLSTTPESL